MRATDWCRSRAWRGAQNSFGWGDGVERAAWGGRAACGHGAWANMATPCGRGQVELARANSAREKPQNACVEKFDSYLAPPLTQRVRAVRDELVVRRKPSFLLALLGRAAEAKHFYPVGVAGQPWGAAERARCGRKNYHYHKVL